MASAVHLPNLQQVVASSIARVAVRDNSQQSIASLDEINALRVSSVSNFLACPAKWRYIMLNGSEKATSAAMRIGTAVHWVIERYLTRQIELNSDEWHQELLNLEKIGVREHERHALYRYLLRLEPRRKDVVAIEHEFRISLIDGAPDIIGHIDAIFADEDGGITILDHKTNRFYESVSAWKTKLQPLFYILGMSRVYPNAPIRFQVGYVNLGEVLSWESSPRDIKNYEQYLKMKYATMWQELQVYRRTGEWPERIHDGCGLCPLKQDCVMVRALLSDAKWALTGSTRAKETLGERYLALKGAQGVLSALGEELREQVIETISESGEPIVVGDRCISLKNIPRRELSLKQAMKLLLSVARELSGEELAQYKKAISQRLNKIASVRIGEFVALGRLYPKLSEEFAKVASFCAAEKPTLTVTRRLPNEPEALGDRGAEGQDN